MPSSSNSAESTCESPAEKLRDVVAGWIDMVASQGERAIDAFGMLPPGKPGVPHADVSNPQSKWSSASICPGSTLRRSRSCSSEIC